MTVLVPQRRILRPRISIPRLNFRRLGDPSFNRLGVQGQPWGLGRAAVAAEQSYSDKVAAIESANLLGYWRLQEAAGGTADNYEGTAARDGSYINTPTLGQTGIGDGETAVSFDKDSNERVSLYSASLDGVFDGAELTVAGWIKVTGSGTWTDAARRIAIMIGEDTTENYIYIDKTASNNELHVRREGGNTAEQVTVGSQTSTDWIHVGATVSELADEVKFYIAGSQAGGTQGTLGAYVGALTDGVPWLAGRTGAADDWDGLLAHWAVWSKALSSGDFTSLATV